LLQFFPSYNLAGTLQKEEEYFKWLPVKLQTHTVLMECACARMHDKVAKVEHTS
jgi:hypothetical protein